MEIDLLKQGTNTNPNDQGIYPIRHSLDPELLLSCERRIRLRLDVLGTDP
jgi:hypothetical protein